MELSKTRASYPQPTDCGNCRGAQAACDIQPWPARHHQPPPQLHTSFSSTASSMPSPQTLNTESPPPSYHHHYGHAPVARSSPADSGQQLLALVEQLGLKLDRLERDNAQLRADVQALTTRQLETDATVDRLRAQLAAATVGPRNTTATTTTTTGEPAAKRSRRSSCQDQVPTGPNGDSDRGGALLAFRHRSGDAQLWRSLSSLLNLRRLMPFLNAYVLPDTFVAPDLRRPLLCTQATTGGAAPPVFVFVNSAMCELFKCSPADIIGQPLTSFVALDREKAISFAQTRSKSLFRARSGQLWRAECSLHIFFDQHGDPKHVLNSLVRWEPGRLEGSEAFDQWTPVSELCKQLISSHPTPNMRSPHTPHAPHAMPAGTAPHRPTTSSPPPSSAGDGPQPPVADLFPPWVVAPGDLTLDDLSPSDYWTLL